LYDPAGVGGTHVMYVLHHADTPQAYAGLPKDPAISPLVGLWKGLSKPLALLAMGAAVLAGFFHYVRTGPQLVEEDEHPTVNDPAVHEVDPSVHTYDPRGEDRP
jgi:formate dehydrogenase iron-sulfur subunit